MYSLKIFHFLTIFLPKIAFLTILKENCDGFCWIDTLK